MKKALLALVILIAVKVNAQNLDTIRVRSLTLQAQDWAWFAGVLSASDSLSANTINLIRAKIQSNIPASWATNVTLDSLPGKYIVFFYQVLLSAPSGEVAARYSAIKAAIAAKTNISTWINAIDTRANDAFINRRTLGKHKLIDN